jgi:hypothetical protein
MSWTVVCFCGNIYTAPPDRCDVCQKGFDHATEETTSAAETGSSAATRGDRHQSRPAKRSQLPG